jgi:2-polyprenyl-6-hydroxyphenyl methylase/3-demethylubiquinone-9 3-methyltransferase
MLTRDQINEIVNKPGQKKDTSFPQYFDENNPRHKRQHIRFPLIIENVVGPKVLDAGCGRGLTSLLLSEREDIKEIHAVDLQKSVLVDARENVKSDKVTFHHGFVEELGFEDESFDTVVLTEVIEHVYDVDKTLKGIHRVLKPGGRLVITCPNKGKINKLHFRTIDLKFMKKHGGKYFKIDKLKTIEYPGPGPGSVFFVGVK